MDGFGVGDEVELHGLAATMLNGLQGRVADNANTDVVQARVQVTIQAGGKPSTKAIKPENLRLRYRAIPQKDGDEDPDPQNRGQFKSWTQHPIDSIHKLISAQMSYFRKLPYIRDPAGLAKLIAEGPDKQMNGDFSWSLNFDPRFYARLNYEGFLPICSEVGGDDDLHVLMPKLHTERCVLPWHRLHITKKVRKCCKSYRLTVNTAIERVFAGLRKQHGENWIYRPVREALRALHRNGERKAKFDGTAISFELWEGSTLVAGEVGLMVGANYTSYSGFYEKDGAGSVQICAMVALLEKRGIHLLDLGQNLPYKLTFGAELLARKDFVKAYHEGRATPSPDLSDGAAGWSCDELIRPKAAALAAAAAAAAAEPTAPPTAAEMERQQKRRDRVAAAESRKAATAAAAD